MFQPEGDIPLTILINTGGFVGDVVPGSVCQRVARICPADMAARPRLRHQFLVTAGLLNILAMVTRSKSPRGGRNLMPKMNLSHFEAALLFALSPPCAGVVTKRTARDRLHYACTHRLFRGGALRPRLVMYFGHD